MSSLFAFRRAVDIVLEHEGGYVDNHADHGGPTKYGLTLHDLKLGGLSDDVATLKALTQDQARSVYLDVFWTPGHYDELQSDNLAVCLFDQAVLDGTAAIAGLQTLLDTHPDGVLGPLTVAAANREPNNVVALEFLHARVRYYVGIVKADASQIQFLTGWLDRLFDLVKYCSEPS